MFNIKFLSVELPAPGSNPVITGGDIGGTTDTSGKQFYKPGDLLNLTCTSAPSNPPATLEWRINGQKVYYNLASSHTIIAQAYLEIANRPVFNKASLEILISFELVDLALW